MPRFDKSYWGLDRLLGRAKGLGIRLIELDGAASSARKRLAAAMSIAMMKGDVEAVVAALTSLGAPTPREDMHQS